MIMIMTMTTITTTTTIAITITITITIMIITIIFTIIIIITAITIPCIALVPSRGRCRTIFPVNQVKKIKKTVKQFSAIQPNRKSMNE